MKIKGLLLKDFYELWAQAKVLILLTALYLVIPLINEGSQTLGNVALLMLAMMPASAIGYDERCKWERYALSMPVSKRELHLSKFLLGVIAIFAGVIFQGVPALILGRTGILATLPIMAGAALLYICLSLPLLFKFGMEKGRLYFLLLTVLFLVGGGILIDKLGLVGEAETMMELAP